MAKIRKTAVTSPEKSWEIPPFSDRKVRITSKLAKDYLQYLKKVEKEKGGNAKLTRTIDGLKLLVANGPKKSKPIDRYFQLFSGPNWDKYRNTVKSKEQRHRGPKHLRDKIKKLEDRISGLQGRKDLDKLKREDLHNEIKVTVDLYANKNNAYKDHRHVESIVIKAIIQLLEDVSKEKKSSNIKYHYLFPGDQETYQVWKYKIESRLLKILKKNSITKSALY